MLKKLLLIIIWIPLLTFSQTESDTDTAKTKLIFGNKSKIQEWLDENKVPAIGIGIIRDGQIKEIGVYGNLADGQPAPYNAIFRVASLTKPIYALLALKLVNNGDWNLDEPIYSYWVDPDVKNDPRHKKLTTRHILSHQTGFLNWRKLHKTKKLTFDFEPGSKYQYSGEGIVYLKRAIENKFKQPIKRMIDSLIFKPLDMKNSYLYWNKEVENSSRYAYNHNKNRQLLETNKVLQSNNSMGNLLCTVEDYSKFVVHILNGANLSKELFDEMLSHQVETNYESHFGLGWEIIPEGNGEKVLMHTGGDPGVSTLAMFLPKSKKGIVIFSNSDNGGYILWEKLLKNSILR